MNLFHITFSARGRASLFPSRELRHRVLHAIANVCGAVVVLFCIVDDHVHLVVMVPPGQAGIVGRDLLFALRAIATSELDPPHVRQVNTRAHAEWLVEYLLLQTGHHGIPGRASAWEGSCAWDLLGARVLPGLQLQVHEALPRLTLDRVLAVLDLQPDDVEPASLQRVRSAGATRLVAACRRATATSDLTGRHAPSLRAKATASRLARASGLHLPDLAVAMGLPPRTVRGLVRLPAADADCWAALRQLALEETWMNQAHSAALAGPVPGRGWAAGSRRADRVA